MRLLILLLLVVSQNICANGILPPPTKISPHVYAWIGPHGGPNKENKGFRMNMAFVVGKRSIAVIETGFYPQMAREMIKQIGEISSLPISHAINTNSQPDRFFGNQAFAEKKIKILAHAKEIKRMRENSSLYAMMVEQSQGFAKDSVELPPLPNVSITDKYQIDLGGNVIVKLESRGAAHTPAPLIVEIPIDKVIYAGDVLYSGRLLAIVSGGNIKQWMGYQKYFQQFNNYRFIPGHGKPARLQSFHKPTFNYLNLLYSHMSKMVDGGVELMEAVNKLDQSAFQKLENFKDLAGRNANRAYLEVEQELFN